MFEFWGKINMIGEGFEGWTLEGAENKKRLQLKEKNTYLT